MLQHRGSTEITTPRLRLRPFTPEDRDAMFRNWASDPEVTRYLTWPAHTSTETTGQVLQTWLDEAGKPSVYRWGIVIPERGPEVWGCIDVVRMNEALPQAEIGYCLSRAQWGRGIMTEALRAVTAHLKSCGFVRVTAVHDVNNPASGRVMVKAGMTYEGTLRCAIRNSRHELCDVAVYASVFPE